MIGAWGGVLALLLSLSACATRPAPGPALPATINYALNPTEFDRGPRAATGAYVWAHGRAGDQDQRALPLPAHVRAFAGAGYDVFRFDRVPYADDTLRATYWLRDCLRALRRMGYRRIVVAGQSRGAWNALAMIDTPGLADVVLAFSPAAQGMGGRSDQAAQLDELRRIVNAAPASGIRLAVAQFQDDWFAAGPDARAKLFASLGGRLGGLLLIDRPAGFSGHGAANDQAFGERYGACLVGFASGGPGC